MATHIFSVNEYQTALELGYSETLNEGLLGKWRTKNKLAKMLAPTIATGKDVFDSINDNVSKLEDIVEEYNEKVKDDAHHRRSVGEKVEDTLTVTFDRALLTMQSLIDLSDIKVGSFTKDVLMCNIVNYKIFVAPIRMAQIMSLGYQYYMAIIRQSLQSALIMIELYADTFFAMVREDINGERAKYEEIYATARNSTISQLRDIVENIGSDGAPVGGTKYDANTRKLTTDLLKQFRQMSTEYNKMHNDTRYGGYRQNIFQEGGHNIESLLRDNTGKELQAMQERFTQLGSKPSKDGEDNMVGSYASAVKANAEKRAYRLCAKMNMNMMRIVKMFSLRSQEGLAALLDRLNQNELKVENALETTIDGGIDKMKGVKVSPYKNEPIVTTAEAQKKERAFFKAVGIDLLGEKAVKRLLDAKGSLSYVKFLTEEKFTYRQAVSIIEEKSTTVGDYEEVTDDNTGDKYWRPVGYRGRFARKKFEASDDYSDIATEKYGLKYNKETGEFDSTGDVHIGKDLVSNGTFAVQFGRIKGNFNCSSLGLISMKNCPKRVDGNLNCTDNGKLEYDEKHFYGYLPSEMKGKIIADEECDTDFAKHYYKKIK